MLQSLVEKVNHDEEADVKNAEDSSLTNILPAVFLTCQFLKANSQMMFTDEVVTDQPQ